MENWKETARMQAAVVEAMEADARRFRREARIASALEDALRAAAPRPRLSPPGEFRRRALRRARAERALGFLLAAMRHASRVAAAASVAMAVGATAVAAGAPAALRDRAAPAAPGLGAIVRDEGGAPGLSAAPIAAPVAALSVAALPVEPFTAPFAASGRP